MEQDEFDIELSMLRVDVEDTGPGWGCISPQQSRRLYVHVRYLMKHRNITERCNEFAHMYTILPKTL